MPRPRGACGHEVRLLRSCFGIGTRHHVRSLYRRRSSGPSAKLSVLAGRGKTAGPVGAPTSLRLRNAFGDSLVFAGCDGRFHTECLYRHFVLHLPKDRGFLLLLFSLQRLSRRTFSLIHIPPFPLATLLVIPPFSPPFLF